MQQIVQLITRYNKPIFIVLFVCCLLPFVTPAIALFAGLAFALTAGQPYPKFSKKTSKYLLQFSVVGLGFGMNLYASLQSGKEGMLFTIVSVFAVLALGMWLGKRLLIDRKTSYLIAAGTAICGGSAIAAVGPVVKADDNQMSMSLGTIFILNAIALFIFPPIGHLLGLTQEQFGLWAAIAIHDTSSVVGAGAAYGETALEIATMVKLTRALWIIPITILTMFLFKQKGAKITIPWFILFFILAMVANTFLSLPEALTRSVVWAAKQGLTLTLFLIGAGLSRQVIRQVGIRPMVQGVLLWIFIGAISLGVILLES
ncbi:MAG: putative sulfate exporter family transporter [bacterium]|nr:putative sulfate exporter family transporter [bacterium]MDD7721887.1 putative sulfate exporter family transporter [bacterium]MDY4101753.1 putative sulfate exporter family transporter [Parabacteroides sp.]MDY4845774.1 putative sulfate exporter family transporter [Parabacteroides sp.]